ncbi:MAG: 50S ribosomal protein L13 [Candidatus Aenigmarchaeota archaeon]|nr:50S ribosomal protein L13 [Candidatus Aenigmarchaeota archaeon]
MKVIDGKNAVLGRLSSATAKHLLAGEEVIIVNAEKAIITGGAKDIKEKYLERRRRGSPQHGPFFPKQPAAIVRRTIRGMIPYKTNKGRKAMKALRVYAGVPEELKDAKIESIAVKQIKSDYIRVGDLAKILGGK